MMSLLALVPVAIVGATVWTEPGKKLEGPDTVVVLDKDRVTAVGRGVAVPAGAQRIDGHGKVVTAGLIDPSTGLGLTEVSLEPTANDGEPIGDDGIHAAYRVIDALDPRSAAIPVARVDGVTSAIVAPSTGFIAGTSAWISLAPAVDPGAAILRAPLALHVTLGEGARGKQIGSRGQAVERLREALDDGAAYARRRNDFERNQTRRFAASRLDLETLAEVAAGRLPLVVTAHRATDILAALRLAGERRLRLVIVGGTEAWMVAAQLARAKVAVVMDPTSNLPSSFEQLQVRDDAPAVLARAGVPVAFSPMSTHGVRNLRQLAGIAVGAGLSWDDALAAITAVPANLFPRPASEPRRGVIVAGAAADVVVWSGDPLEIATAAERVYINGQEQSHDTRQRRLLERYRKQ